MLASILLDGLGLGAIYAFIALGYTMVYGIIRLINFAHGEFFMVGGFVGWFVLRDSRIDELPPGRTPVLKSRVQRWLVQKHEVLAFVQARPAEGGAGALVVLLQPGGS